MLGGKVLTFFCCQVSFWQHMKICETPECTLVHKKIYDLYCVSEHAQHFHKSPFHHIETTKPPPPLVTEQLEISTAEGAQVEEMKQFNEWMNSFIIYSSRKKRQALAGSSFSNVNIWLVFFVVYIIVSWIIRQNRHLYMSYMYFFLCLCDLWLVC